MNEIVKPYDMDIYIPVCIPAKWTVVRNELLRDFLKPGPDSTRWEWLFSAVYESKGFNLEVQIHGIHCELGVSISGVVLKLITSNVNSDLETELMVVGPECVKEEELVRKLSNSLFGFALAYLEDLRSAGGSF